MPHIAPFPADMGEALVSPDLAPRMAALSTERLVALVRALPSGLSAEAEAAEAAAMRELAGRMAPGAYAALCDALA